MKILIAGSGKMGADLFRLFLPLDHEICWLCLDDAEAQRARDQFVKRSARQVRSGLITQADYDARMKKVTVTSQPNDAAGCDLLIESIWEKTEEKRALFITLDRILPPSALFTSNTSSVPLEVLVPSEERRPFFCGLHFFFPSAMKNLVEINAPSALDPQSLKTLQLLAESLGHQALVLHAPHHFLMNRLLLPVQNEAVRILQEFPLQPAPLDALVRQQLFPIGIFEFFDHVGMDVMLASVSNYMHYQPDGKDYTPLRDALRKKVQENELGIKTGRGFYTYPLPAEPAPLPWPEPVAGALLKRLEEAWYTELRRVLQTGLVPEPSLDTALCAYWGETSGFVDKGRRKGYLI